MGCVMGRVAAINDATRAAGRVPAPGMPWGTDAPCEACGRDVFGCECEGAPADLFTADDLAAAVADSDRKRAAAVASERIALGLAKDRAADLVELRRRLAESEARAADLEARAAAAPGERTETRARLAAGRVRGDAAALARAEAAQAPRSVRERPARLVEYLARLVDPPRVAYAHALADVLAGDAAEIPADVLSAAQGAAWFDDVDGKVRRRSGAGR